jgi:acetate kinase
MHRVLVLNAGSSTLKWSVLPGSAGAPSLLKSVKPLEPLDPLAPLAEGTIEWDSADPGRQAEQVRAVLRADLPGAPAGGAGRAGTAKLPVDAVGHRVVHGGARFRASVLVTAAVRQALGDLVDVDPLHTRAALAGIDAVSSVAPGLPQVAAFDTSFHATLPPAAALYPVPWEWTDRFGLRRYGFHGLSVSYASRRLAELTAGTAERLLVCHLGSGCSLTAVAGGASVDTTMGFTPLEGVMMGTRSGSVDPGLLLHLARRRGLSLEDLEDGLQHHSGLAGVSGAGGDLRSVLAAAAGGSRRAALAYDLFVHSLVRMAGAMVAVLGGLDHLVLTGGIGEHSAELRAAFVSRLGFLGARLDQTANAAPQQPGTGAADREISFPGSAVRIFVITAREDLEVRRELLGLLSPPDLNPVGRPAGVPGT